MARIDVAIPNYNYGRYLEASVRSVLEQEIPVRVLILDNASTDDSVEIATEMARADPRIEVVTRTKNIGLCRSLNEAVDWAASDYFVFLSSDDLLPPGALKRAIDVMDANPDVVLAYGSIRLLKDGSLVPVGGRPVSEAPWRIHSGRKFIEMALNGSFVTLSPVVRTCMQKRVGYFRDFLSNDEEIWLRIACHGRVASTRSPQAIQRVHTQNQSRTTWTDPIAQFKDRETLIATFFASVGALPDAKDLQALAVRSLAKCTYWTAVSRYLRGDRANASKLFQLAVASYPPVAYWPPLDQLLRYPDLADRLKNVVFHWTKVF